MSQLFVIFAVMIIMPLIYKKKDIVSDGEIIFEFTKNIKYLFLICTIIMLIISFVFLLMGLYNHDDNYIGSTIFAIFSLCSFFMYLLAKNKKIIYKDDNFYTYNVFNKLKIYYAKEITKAVEVMGDGMLLIFNNNSKLKIDMQMENYSKIKEILEKYNIEYRDQNGNNKPKGW